MPTLVYRILVAGLCAMALVGQVVQLDSVFWNALGVAGGWGGRAHPAYASVVAVDVVLTVVMVALALLLAFHPDRERGSGPLALAVSVWAYLLAYPGLITLLRPEEPGSLLRLLFQVHFLAVEMVGLGALLRFSALFPRRLDPADIQDPSTLGTGLGVLQRLRGWLLTPRGPWIAAGLATLAAVAINTFLGHPPSEAALLVLVDGARFAALSVVVLNLRRSYLLSKAEERESARWLAVGFALLVGSLAVLMGGNVLALVTGWRIPVLNWRPLVLDLGLLGFVWGTGMGVFYRGSLRSGTVGRRVVVYSVLGMSTLLLAAGLEALFGDVLLARLALPGGVGTALAALCMVGIHLRFGRPLGRALEESLRKGADRADATDLAPAD